MRNISISKKKNIKKKIIDKKIFICNNKGKIIAKANEQ
jgi:hypothetical protein